MIMVVIIVVGFHLFLISIGLLPDLHQTALSCCSFPIPNHPFFTFPQRIPAIVVDREIFLVSHPRHTPDSLASSAQLFFLLLIDTLIHFARSAPPFATSCSLLL